MIGYVGGCVLHDRSGREYKSLKWLHNHVHTGDHKSIDTKGYLFIDVSFMQVAAKSRRSNV